MYAFLFCLFNRLFLSSLFFNLLRLLAFVFCAVHHVNLQMSRRQLRAVLVTHCVFFNFIVNCSFEYFLLYSCVDVLNEIEIFRILVQILVTEPMSPRRSVEVYYQQICGKEGKFAVSLGCTKAKRL